ncbi:hypothetical protein V502_01038 [Pseudogymnoascus sp. VKM F-4520 (FW-2644)]|nr:hypothetical protein V502_01038 [Pseudogymnoascus sp. VKM F-4520 (FW-2644)]
MASPNPATADSPRQSNPAFQLPPEIVKTIVDQVPNSTIKNLRLTCRFYSETAALRLNRVFISANPRNVEVFTAIANHKAFRSQITEIIWDDALLYAQPVPRDEVEAYYASDDEYEDEASRGRDLDRPSLIARAQQVAEQMPMEEAWAYYQELLQQQRDVQDSKAHIYALEKHIGSFPALQRITVTAATHGVLYNPLYETPMIRAFPRGFNHYIPCGWPVPGNFIPQCDEWDDYGSDWQGFQVATRLLAEDRDSGRVTDLCIDAHELEMGLRVFERENRTLNDFEAVLARPNFTHLQLDLMVDSHSRQADVYCSGFLKRALAGRKGLEYLSFRTNMDVCPSSNSDQLYVPLRTIFTPTSHPRLQHFGLAHLYVRQDDLLALLASLPKTLQSVELSTIQCMPGEGSYRTLLWGIRDTLGWKERDQRPTLTVSTVLSNPFPGRAIWVEDELYSFLYQDGSNPFGDDPAMRNPDYIKHGFGRQKDSFDPDHERPHVDHHDLADMGYIRPMGVRPAGRRPMP